MSFYFRPARKKFIFKVIYDFLHPLYAEFHEDSESVIKSYITPKIKIFLAGRKLIIYYFYSRPARKFFILRVTYDLITDS